VRVRLINLDRSEDRLAKFTAYNGHLTDIVRFAAIDGKQARRSALAGRGIIDPALDYTDGALGNLLSHLALWEEAIESAAALTLCEDDVIFNHDFERQAAGLIASMDPGWHMIFWGWNFDAFTVFELVPGLSPFLAQFDQHGMRAGIESFRSATISPRPYRLLAAFGIPCYTVSPAGAALLKRLVLPVTNHRVFVPSVNRCFANRDLSLALLGLFPRIQVFASFPPLIITPNDHATSTVLPHTNLGA